MLSKKKFVGVSNGSKFVTFRLELKLYQQFLSYYIYSHAAFAITSKPKLTQIQFLPGAHALMHQHFVVSIVL